MSQENVEMVLSLFEAPDVDYAQLYRDDSLWSGQAEALAPFVHADLECVMYAFGSEERYAGLDGLRAFMLDWTAPWAMYRIETEKAIDLGERVLLLNRDRGLREGSTQEVEGRIAALFTIRDGKVVRIDAYTTRAEALEAVGLSEQDAHADSA
jgi:ketosteroid isomerase-like protein